MFTISASSPPYAIEVALPLESWSRHTKPGAASAIAFTGSRSAAKSASLGESTGAFGVAMFTCAM